MIFSTQTREIYWVLSILLRNYDISMLHRIMNYKKEYENKDTLEWYIEQGFIHNQIEIDSHDNLTIKSILFNPHKETYFTLKNIHIRIFHLKILLEIFAYPGFILIKSDDNYYESSLRDKLLIMKDIINENGIYEIQNKLFQHRVHNLTDMNGNQCIRSIILIRNGQGHIREYRTISIQNGIFIDPVDRIPSLMR